MTTLGGSAADIIHCVASDSKGGVYLAGETRSTDFPQAVGTPPSGSNAQILLIKVNAAGEVAYRLLLGGTGDDAAYGVAVDGNGGVHLTGRTSSSDFPVTRGAAQPAKGGGWDGFYLSLAADGKTIRAATFIGGEGEDKGQAIAVDAVGAVYVAGSTQSERFPATAGKRRGTSDAFVAKFDGDTGRRRYLVLLGGAGEDYANGIATGSSGDVWVVGQTNSADLPVTADALQRAKRGLWDGFAAKLDNGSGQVKYATFLGGGPGARTRGIDNAYAVSVDASGSVWVAGETDAADFPVTEGALVKANSGGRRGFVMRLDERGTKTGYASYLGGTGQSTARAVATGSGWAAILGTTSSRDFPAAAGLATAGPGGAGDIFAVVLDRARGTSICAARLGGSKDERAGGAAILPGGVVMIAGTTESSDLASPIAGAGSDVFFATLRCDAK